MTRQKEISLKIVILKKLLHLRASISSGRSVQSRGALTAKVGPKSRIAKLQWLNICTVYDSLMRPSIQARQDSPYKLF